MKALYDVSEVTSGVFAPSDTFSYQSVGLWHNHIVYSTLRMFQHLGTNAQHWNSGWPIWKML